VFIFSEETPDLSEKLKQMMDVSRVCMVKMMFVNICGSVIQ